LPFIILKKLPIIKLGVIKMSHSIDQHLCLSDLLEEDLSSYEFFHGLPIEIQKQIEKADVGTFQEMQEIAHHIGK
jgi:hypothetical protein